MALSVKICGINDPIAMQTAVEAGAQFVGLVFYPPSPRVVDIAQAAKLAALVPHTVTPVGLFVDPTDDQLIATLNDVPLKLIQLHGDETPERVTAIKKLTGLPAMKAIKIASADDLKTVSAYEAISDYLMFDAKVSTPGALPGGNAVAFDWRILKGIKVSKSWMLAGGINAGNLREAVRVTNAKIVDVSSGVEDRPGHKDLAKIEQLLNLAKTL